MTEPDAACTLCPDNTLRSTDGTPRLVDHALLMGFSGSARARRIFTEPVTLDIGGTPVQSNLSDHYGIELIVGAGGSE